MLPPLLYYNSSSILLVLLVRLRLQHYYFSPNVKTLNLVGFFFLPPMSYCPVNVLAGQLCSFSSFISAFITLNFHKDAAYLTSTRKLSLLAHTQ